jgi:response regulator RpfG family c-di-GMP phosphodiesterase
MIKSMGSSSGVAAAGLATDGPLQADAKMMEGGGAVVTPAASGSLEDGPPATTTTANATVAAAASAVAPAAAAAADVGVPEAAAAALTNTATMTVNERRARESIATNPYDVEAWTALCNEAQVHNSYTLSPISRTLLVSFCHSEVRKKSLCCKP